MILEIKPYVLPSDFDLNADLAVTMQMTLNEMY